jgi:hypothetical protein
VNQRAVSAYLRVAGPRAIWPISPVSATAVLTKRRREFRSRKYLAPQTGFGPMHAWLTAEMENGPFRVILEKPPSISPVLTS